MQLENATQQKIQSMLTVHHQQSVWIAIQSQGFMKSTLQATCQDKKLKDFMVLFMIQTLT
ncbi:hypothetical protein C1X30_33485 [Pseudomonas sp. FW305-BF6]|nr:hypothetical protein C1X30_33485 [Pseudomonas sp. FW305-BF6]